MKELKSDYASAERLEGKQLASQIQLLKDHDFIKDILDALADITVILNEHRQIVFANKNLLELLNISSMDQITGLRPGELLSCEHANKEPGGCGTSSDCRFCNAVNAILASQSSGEKTSDDCEVITTGADGNKSLSINVTVAKLKLEGYDNFSIVTIKDITDSNRKDEMEKIFFHDVVNTTGGLRGLAEYAIEYSQEVDGLDILGDIFQASTSLLEEIESYRCTLQTEDAVIEPDFEMINSRSFIDNITVLFENHPDLQNGKIELIKDIVEVDFKSDKKLLRRVIMNMLKNAYEASSSGEPIQIKCHVDKEELVFSVQNNAFISEEICSQMFKRSFSTKGKGRGLGTHSMKLLTEKYLNGKISLTSTIEDGTTVSICIPLGTKV